MSEYHFKTRKPIFTSDNIFFKAFVSTPEIICWLDNQGRLLHYFAEQTNDVKPDLSNLIGASAEKIFPLSLGSKIQERITAANKNNTTEKLTIETVIDGTMLIMQSRITPVRSLDQTMVIFRNITDDHRLRTMSLFQNKLHSQISKISKGFILLTAGSIDTEISNALGQIGLLMQVDRSYIFILKHGGTTMDNVYEWCNKGIEPQIENLKDLPTEIFPWWMKKLNRFENIAISDVSDLPPEAKGEREILESQDIKSVAVVPLIYSSKLIGFIGFDAVKSKRLFTNEVMDLLRLLGDSVINAMERINTEAKIAANKQVIQTVADNVPVLLWMTGADGNYNFFNSRWLEFTGRTFEEECRENWYAQVHPNDKEAVSSALVEAFSTRKPCSIQFKFLRKDDVYRWILVNAVPKNSPDGEYDGFIGSCIDITDQKENEYKYRLMSKRIDISAKFSGAHEKFSSTANLLQQYLELTLNLFGFDGGGVYQISQDRSKAELVTSLFLPDEFIQQVTVLPVDVEPYRTVLVSGIPNYFEMEAGKKYGFRALASIPFYIGMEIGGCINIATKRAHPFSEDDKRILTSIAEEIGKAVYSQNNEDLIWQHRKNVDALFNTINDFLFVLDEKGYILEVNNVVLRRLGYTVQELREMHVIQLHVPERRDEATRIVGEMLAGTTEYCSVPLIAKNGTRIDVETNIVLGKWNNRDVIFGVTRDISERKRTERILHQTEERNRALIESSPDAIVFFNINEVIAFANQECIHLFGYSTSDEMMHMHAADLFSVKDGDVWKSIIADIYEKRNVKYIQTEFLKKNGTVFPSEICCSAMYDVNGAPEGVIVTIRDITDRIFAEEHLRKSEEENKAIVDAVPDLMFRINRTGVFLNCKVPNKEALYVDPELFIGKNIHEILPMDVAKQAMEVMENSFQSKEMKQFEYSLPIGGELHHYEDRIVPLSNNEALSFIRDITDRKRIATSLHQSEQRLQYAFEASNDALWDWDLKTNTVFFSPRWKQMLGNDVDEIGIDLDELEKRVHPDELEKVKEKIQNNLKGKADLYISEHRMKRKDGTYMWVLDRGKVVERDQDNNPLRMIGTLIDISERVETDLQIKRMSIAIEQSFTSIVITDLNAVILYANAHFWKITGYDVGELLGKNMATMKSGLTPKETIQSLWKTILAGKVWEGELVNKKKNGELYNESVIISPIKNSFGVIDNYIAIRQDITTRKKNDAELEWNISLLQLMANSSPLGFLVVDNRDDRILYFNHRFCEIWGITDLEERMKAEGMKNNDIIPYCIPILVDPVAFGESCKPLQDVNNTVVVEDEIQFLNSVTIRRYSTQIRGKQGQYFGRFYIFEDITNQKLAEEQLKENERTVSTKLNVAEGRIKDMSFFLDQASDAIIVTTVDDEIVYVNDSVQLMYGWKADELINKKFTNQFYNANTSKKNNVNGILSALKWEDDHEHQIKSGMNIWVHLSATVVTESLTGEKSILYVITDISKSRQLQEQATHSQRLESIGTLASGIAHDMNNILGPILIALSHFDRLLTDDKSRNMNKLLQANVRRGADLIKQILGFSRNNQNDILIVQMKHLVREIEKLIRETFPKSIIFEFFPSKELFPVMANPTQMHQVLLNLCVNARDAMPTGGKLEIRAENVVFDKNSFMQNINANVGPYCRISISDTGTGIPESIISKIYDPFFTTKGVGKGTGLGLFNVATIIKAHKGFIDLTSEPGKGTTFTIYLPAASSGNIEKVMEDSGDFPKGNGETILLMDDEVVIRDITKATLEDYNYNILTASNGAEGLGIYAANKDTIKIIVLDVMMPHLDGPSTVRAIQTMDNIPGIVIMSGIHANVKVMKELGLPESQFITKPFPIDTLLKVIHSILHP